MNHRKMNLGIPANFKRLLCQGKRPPLTRRAAPAKLYCRKTAKGGSPMDLLMDAAAFSLPAFGAVMLLAQFAVLWVGERPGRRHAGRLEASGRDPVESVGVVTGALLGLLGFALALTISIATARFEERRRTALDEANAIGTAWLRAHAIGHLRGEETARLLEGYIETRVAWLSAPRDSAVLATAIAETNWAQTLIWGHAAAITQERPDPVAASLLASLNDSFDLVTTQRWAFRGQMPAEVPRLLLVAWSSCLVLIADLANPRIGWVRADTSPYAWTIQGWRGGIPIPPAP